MLISLIIAAPAALAAGALAALGFKPVDLWWLTIIGLALLFGLVDRAGARWRAALIGWCWGLGHFALGLNWIAKAFTFQAKMPAALGWVAVVGLAAYLALFIAVPAALAQLARPGWPRAAALAGGLVAGEMLRGALLSGFPWDPLGAAWLAAGDMAQFASLIGTFGLSALIALAGAALWLLVMGPRLADRGMALGTALALGAAALTAPGLNGETYYPDLPTIFAVQPNIGEDQRYSNADANLDTYLRLTRTALADRAAANPVEGVTGTTTGGAPQDGAAPDANGDPIGPGVPTGTTSVARDPGLPDEAAAGIVNRTARQRGAVVVWPEGAVQPPVEADPRLRARLAAVLGPQDLLVFGGTGLVTQGGRVVAYANSLFVLNARGRIAARYDKSHLVPLGEYVPARGVMAGLGLARLVPGDYDFRAGPGLRTLTLPGAPPVGPLICYEVIFPGAVVDAGNRPGWLVNVSNDAWYGDWGPPQHLAQAQLRSIEEGLPMVRATPTGVSAIIDAHGNLVARQGPDTAGVIAATLPPPLPPPFYARSGHWPPVALALLLGAAAAFASRRRI